MVRGVGGERERKLLPVGFIPGQPLRRVRAAAIGILQRDRHVAAAAQIEPALVGPPLHHRQPEAVQPAIGHAGRAGAGADFDFLRAQRVERPVGIPTKRGIARCRSRPGPTTGSPARDSRPGVPASAADV